MTRVYRKADITTQVVNYKVTNVAVMQSQAKIELEAGIREAAKEQDEPHSRQSSLVHLKFIKIVKSAA